MTKAKHTPTDGGPAFPISREDWYEPGMSLRDWFAGQVMERILSLTQDEDGGWSPDAVAIGCYAMADAMIEARKIVARAEATDAKEPAR